MAGGRRASWRLLQDGLRATARHGPRIALSLLPLALALLHASGVMPLRFFQRADDLAHDLRLRAWLPNTREERVVIVAIDSPSLAEVGRWPWPRDQLARLTDELFERQQVAQVGFDLLFDEPDDRAGLARLKALADKELKDQPGFAARLRQLELRLDHDGAFARSLLGRPVTLGYYLSDDAPGRGAGVLPAPLFALKPLAGQALPLTRWDGYGANTPRIAAAAPAAGFFTPRLDRDGVVRSVPLVAEHQGRVYESLALAMFRQHLGMPAAEPVLAHPIGRAGQPSLHALRLRQGERVAATIAMGGDGTVVVPYRGPGGAQGGSFRHIPAADVLHGRLPPQSLRGRIVLVGTTAPGLNNRHVTPVGEAYPGVEVHASVLSGLLDGRLPLQPQQAREANLLVLLLAGLVLAVGVPLLSAPRAILLSAAVVLAVVGVNSWLYVGAGLVLPVGAVLAMALALFALNMSYGFFVESRSRRELARLFGTYVPPELVAEMVQDPDSYSMTATHKELTVMFCDMRGFTRMSEQMEPTQLQALLNGLFTRLTDVIREHRGTIDKYMGDCVMAFWGAPVDAPDHAGLAVQAALAMDDVVHAINREHRARGLPQIGLGIGLSTGPMCVGDMGSQRRRAYTVIGDAVNLGARLEGLSKVYGVDIVASEATRRQAPQFVWQELDRVRVVGRAQAVSIHRPLAPAGRAPSPQAAQVQAWAGFLQAYRDQDWPACEAGLAALRQRDPDSRLYALYAERLAVLRLRPFDPQWDGTTHFDSK